MGRAPTLYLRGKDFAGARQFSFCNMSDKEVVERAQWPEITEEELLYAQDLWRNREPFPDEERLDNWLLVMEDIVVMIESSYYSTFRLLESTHVNNKYLLKAFRALYIYAMAGVNVVKRERTSG
jgi:hypothetical protein